MSALSAEDENFLVAYQGVAVVSGLLIPQIANAIWTGDFSFTSSSLFMIAWSGLPYGVLAVLTMFMRNRVVLVLLLCAFVSFEFYCLVALKSSASSTAALGFFVVPVYQLVAVLPVGIALGYAISVGIRFFRRRRASAVQRG